MFDSLLRFLDEAFGLKQDLAGPLQPIEVPLLEYGRVLRQFRPAYTHSTGNRTAAAVFGQAARKAMTLKLGLIKGKASVYRTHQFLHWHIQEFRGFR